jgi:succinyl-diaminopimelate desuccinylase
MMMDSQKVFSEIDKLKDKMVEALAEFIRVPAIGPENGGDGESKKADKLATMLGSMGFDRVERHDAKDTRVSSKKRPNIIAYTAGENTSETLWIVTHMDIVPAGEDSLWTVTKPFEPLVKNGKIYGRGSEDNMQSMFASIFAVKALKNLGIKPRRTVALCFVSDEEMGSEYGIRYLIAKGLFKPSDLVVVPDGGNGEGSFIEIAEKSVLWLRIRVFGKQTHASTPGKGLNAHRIGMQFALVLDKMLHENYSEKDDYFDPPENTFEPTKKEKNVDAVNIVPGEDVTCFDCRILPRYDLKKVFEDIQNTAKDFEKKTGAKIATEILHENVAPKPTPANAKIVTMLEQTLKQVRKMKPIIGGIGGGTCAAYFREVSIPAVVWSTVDEIAHQPNEYAIIENLVNDAKIFAYLAIA